jgi:hypothetical protein
MLPPGLPISIIHPGSGREKEMGDEKGLIGFSRIGSIPVREVFCEFHVRDEHNLLRVKEAAPGLVTMCDLPIVTMG